MEQPLRGVRVLEIGGGIAAAYAAHLLAGYGAEVVRTEVVRELLDGLSAEEETYLLPAKQRVAPSAPQLATLARAADIIIEDGPPGTLAGLGLSPVALRAERADQVIVSISPYGQSGPHANWQTTPLVSFAAGGMMSLTGDPDREPLQTGGRQAYYLAGLDAFGAALTTYFGALCHGEGDWVDLSVQECAAGMLELYAPAAAMGEPAARRFGNYHRAVWAIYPCADGYVGVHCLERQVPALFRVVGVEALGEERFTDPLQRSQHDEELSAYVVSFLVDHTGDELLDIARANRIPLGKVRTPQDLLTSPALSERTFFDSVTDVDGLAATVPGRPFPGFAWRGGGALHAPGADTDAVLAAWAGGESA